MADIAPPTLYVDANGKINIRVPTSGDSLPVGSGGTGGVSRNSAMNGVLPDPITHEGQIMHCKSGNWGADPVSEVLAGTYATLDANGQIDMSVLPQTLTDSLNALLEEQQQTNELLFMILQQQSIENQEKELPANVT